MTDKTGVYIGGGIALVTVLGLLAGGIFLLRRELGQSGFATVQGKVTRSQVATDVEVERVDIHRARVNELDLEYVYEVDGKEYRGYRITGLNVRTSNVDTVKAQVDKYPKGSKVTVHYDPADPATSVLETGVTILSIALTAVGIIGLVVFLLVVRKFA